MLQFIGGMIDSAIKLHFGGVR